MNGFYEGKYIKVAATVLTYLGDYMTEKHRVQKLLSNRGYCSRRRAEELIMQGRVTVNNKLVSIGASAAESDVIRVDGQAVAPIKKIIIAFHKPVGCVTALQDKFHKTIMDYIDLKERVFPIGRLDFNTSGLLLLTNDGDFANSVMHPRYEVMKTYEARCDTVIGERAVQDMRRGIIIDEKKVQCAVRLVRTNVIELTLHEGRKHIVKKMLKECGLHVITLKRTRIGKLELGALAVGRWRVLTEDEARRVH